VESPADLCRFKIVVEYDGSRFVGWQVQPDGPSIQGELARAAEAVVGHPVNIAGSGRTDAGVHALGQVAAFDTSARRDERAIRDGMNAHLPDDIAVVAASRAPADFDPRRWVERKHYRYAWLDRRSRSPLRQARTWHVRDTLDQAAMQAAADLLVGRHDFSAFRAVGCQAAHAERYVQALTLSRRGDELHLDAVGNGFLRHMVRIVAGTLTEVGLGRRAPAWVGEVLAGRDRAAGGRTAPAHGLTLVEVVHGDRARPWADDAE
jgi:tRNA pseudouridine38-40 synthase